MNPVWRVFHPSYLLRENVRLFAGLLFLPVGALAFFLPGQELGPFANINLIFLFALYSGLILHYWRFRSEDLLRLLPGFCRSLYFAITLLFLALLLLSLMELRRAGASVAASFFLGSYVLFWGTVSVFFQPLVDSDRDRSRRALSLLPLLPIYILLFFRPLFIRIMGTPTIIALPLGLLLLGVSLLTLSKAPKEWHDWWNGQRGSVRPSRSRGSWSPAAMLRWMPPGWASPLLQARPIPQGLLSAWFLAPVSPAILIALQWGHLTPPQLYHRLPFFLAIWLLPTLSWALWYKDAASWQFPFLTGYAGGNRRDAVRTMLWGYAKQVSLLALVLLFWPGLGLALLGYAGLNITMILLILWFGMLVMAWAPIAAIGLGLSGTGLILLTGFSFLLDAFMVDGSGNYWFYHHLIHVPFHLRLTAFHLAAALLAILLAGYLGMRRLRQTDWTLQHFTAQRVSRPALNLPLLQPNPAQAPLAAAARVWRPWPALALVAASFFGQTIIAVAIITLRNFLLGAQMGFHAAMLHQQLSPQAMHAALTHIGIGLRVWSGILGYAGAALGALLFLWRYVPRATWRNGTDTGLAWCPPSTWRAYPIALLLALLLLLDGQLLFQFFPPPQHLPAKELGLFDGLRMHGGARYAVLLLLIFLAPLAEEILFRGALYAGLRQRLAPLWSAVIVTVLFILVHIPSKVLQFSYPPALLIVALGALMLIVLRIRYRSLWPGILFHSLWNGGGFLLLLWH